METKPNKDKIIGVIAFAVVFVMSYIAVQHYFFSSIDTVIQKSAKEINRTCPIKIDEFTQLDSVTMPAKKTIQYNYTLIDMGKDEINPDTVEKYIKAQLIETVKTQKKLTIYRKNKVTFIYQYYDKNKNPVYRLPIPPEVYSK